MANSFQSKASDYIDYLNSIKRIDLQKEYSIYSLNKEFEKFNSIK